MQRSTLVLLGFCATATTGRAEPTVRFDVANPAVLRATLIDVTASRPEHITVRAESGARVVAATLTPYARTTTPMTVALLYSSEEFFIGNVEHETEPAIRYPGVLNALKAALDQPTFKTAFPAGSQLVAVSYDAGSRVRFPLGPLAQFRGSALGVERDYRGRLGHELTHGIELALDELDRAATPRRALVVVGDGTDVDPETTKPRLALLKKRALQSGIEVYGVIFKTPLSDEADVITTMIPKARRVPAPDGMTEAFARIAGEIGQHYEATFPLAGLPHDGKAHELTLIVGNTVLDPVSVVLPLRVERDKDSWFPRLGILVALVLAFALGTRFSGFQLSRARARR
jgi:hypothetical protein